MMKRLKFILLTFIAVIGFTACEEDELEFVASEAEEIEFNTSFLENYLLNPSISSNLAERFTWDDANFDVPTNVTYYLQGATLEDFSDYVAGDNLYDLGSNVTNPAANEIPVTVGQMINLATAAGLDYSDGSNTGVLYFRLMAVIGDNGLPSYSSVQGLNVELLETSGGGGSTIMPSEWGIVGSGYNDWGGAGLDGVFYTTAEDNVFVAYANLIDGEIKFRANNDWGTNFGGSGGTLVDGGDNIAVTAGAYKITLNFNDSTYLIEPFTWGIVGSGFNDWGATPDAKFYYDYTTDTFKVGVKLIDGEIKFRFNNDWGLNFGDTGADGKIDDGGENIAVTAGFYNITLDLNNNAYTIESGDVWGIVGSGYNDWGATPDFSFTQVNPDVYVAEVVTLLDGEIKFRASEDWGTNFGDTGADGILDDGGDNIAVTAGLYRITMNLADNSYSLNKIQ